MARLPSPDIEHPDIKPMADRVRRERGGKVRGQHRLARTAFLLRHRQYDCHGVPS